MKPAPRPPLVVAVDDDKDFLEALRQMLAPEYRVEVFSDPAGLPDGLAGLEPDLLLFDLHMPGTDGVRLAGKCRADPRFSDVPVVFLTASRADEDFVRTLKVGADAFLTKPIGAKDLRRRVKAALGGQEAARVF